MHDMIEEETSEYVIQQIVVERALVDGEYRFRVGVTNDVDLCEVMGMLETAKAYILREVGFGNDD